MAEVSLEDYKNMSREQQEYWLVAMRTAREAGLLGGATQPNLGRNSTAGDGNFIT